MGYSIDNANDLLKTFKVQALNENLNGHYILKSLDKYGQRIAVTIKLKNIEFYSGWIVEPDAEYTKHGVKKGDKGIVVIDYAMQGSILVDFTNVLPDGRCCGDCITVDIKDLKVIN